jgi:TetR/AcrR family transcriptional regulator, regulator of cefoperazone and chloramphenicol sensitivity
MNDDLETRQRLLEVAAHLFARRGLNDVTVREICQAARANVAAVNYHFHDKLGLYTAVVRLAIDAIRGTSDVAKQAGAGTSAEQKLRIYTRVFLERIAANGRDAWIHQLIGREMSEPTPAFELIIKQAIRPRMEYLGGLVSELLQCAPDDPRVARCVASIQSQFLFWLTPGVGRVFPRLHLTPATIDELADHIADFSLAGIHALERRRPAPRTAVSRGRHGVKAS